MQKYQLEQERADSMNGVLNLRQQAERLAAEKSRHKPPLTAVKKDELVQELDVHQIELELQNEELRRAQIELRESLDRFANLYDFSPAGYFTIDEHNIIVEANLTFCRMLGTERSGLLKRRIIEYIAKENADTFYACIRTAIKKAVSYACELKMKRADNTLFDARLELIPEEKGLRITVTDITEHKQGELKLIESEKRYRSLFENMIDGYAYCRVIFENERPVDFVVLAVNSAFGRLIGIQDAVGRKLSEVIPGLRESRRELFDIYGRVASSGRSERLEIYLKPVKIWLMVSVYSTELGTFTVIFENITGRKEAEDTAKRKTLELEASNKELEAFDHSIAHDLRQPLRALDGFSAALMEDYSEKLDEKGKEYLNIIGNSSKKMAGMVEGLLRLSGICRSEVHTENVDLSNLAQSIADIIQLSQPARKAEFTIAPAMTAEADRELLNMALTNLIQNAWKFSGKCPQTKIEMGVNRENGQAVYFIKDNGAGFDMQYSDKLFEPFQRLHSSKEFEGTGIGLAIVARIVRHHGGSIWAESKPGEGATFFFTLG